MEFRDLKRQYKLHKTAIDAAMQEVLLAANFISGGQVALLEEKLAEYTGTAHCVACANGTDALQLALMAWGIGKGDAVFVPDFTFFSSGEVVPLVGATPVFVDVCEDTYNIDCDSLEKAIEYVQNHTALTPKVVVAVDLFGQPADYTQLSPLAKKYGLLILEDAAQGFGGGIGSRKNCSFGDIATTSFFPAKPLGCYGDGGAVFTNDDDLAVKLRSLRVHGKGSDKYDNIRIGMNSRLDTLQAAVLLEKMKFFDEEMEACRRVADRYTEKLRGLVQTPVIKDGMFSGWAQYTIRLKSQEERDIVTKQLTADHIPSAVYYKKPMHCQQAFAQHLTEAVECRTTEKICKTCLSLPMHPYMEEAETEAVCSSIRRALTQAER